MSKKKTDADFRQEVTLLVGKDYTFLEEYDGANKKIKCKHNICGYIWSITPHNFLSGKRCPQCANNIKKTTESFCVEVEAITNHQFTLVSDYIDSKTDVTLKCNVCGTLRNIRPSILNSQGLKCKICSQNKEKEFYLTKFKEKVVDKYELVSEYKGSREPVTVHCKQCGHYYTKRADMMLQGIGCPYCNSSKGEDFIANILDNLDIKYIRQKRFESCFYKKQLPFDFYLPNENLLIEYDGIQHYKDIDFFKGGGGYKHNLLRDAIKSDWSSDRGIKLLRIPYTFSKSEIRHALLKKTIDTKADVSFREISYSETKDILYNKHYLHRMPNISYAFGMFYKNNLCGLITYGSSGSPTLAKSINKINYRDVIELNRLYIDDFISESIYNITSKFVSWSLKQIGNHIVVSFADSGMKHFGTIYQATNFMYVGETREQWDAYIGDNKHSRAWVKGYKYTTRKLRTSKYEYIYVTGNKRYKKEVIPNLIKEAIPYPKGVSGRYSIGDSKPEVLKTI